MIQDVRDQIQPLLDALPPVGVIGLPAQSRVPVEQLHVGRVGGERMSQRVADRALIDLVGVPGQGLGAWREFPGAEQGDREISRCHRVEVGRLEQHDRERSGRIGTGQDRARDEIGVRQDKSGRRAGIGVQLVVVDHSEPKVVADVQVQPVRCRTDRRRRAGAREDEPDRLARNEGAISRDR